MFADIGRASVPPRIVSVVMVLQRWEWLSDREAVDRISFDLRWNYAAVGVDPEARHGHETAARGCDGYKGHIAIDPDSEIITATTVTPILPPSPRR